MSAKKFCVQKILEKKEFGTKKFLDPKNFRFKKILSQQNFGSKKILGQKKCWVQKNVGSKKIFRSEKHVSTKTNFCQKFFCVQIKFQKKMYPNPFGIVYWPIWILKKHSFWISPPEGIGLNFEGSSWGVVGLFLSLRETYILNLKPLLSLEPLEKVPGGGGGWWVVGGVKSFLCQTQLWLC